MTDNFKMGILGDTGLKVRRLGLGASYGAPAAAFLIQQPWKGPKPLGIMSTKR